MIIVVNDANVLIDLVNLHLLGEFFSLELIFHTTDLVLGELNDDQLEQLQEYINGGILNITTFSSEELIHIGQLQVEKPQLSEQDCSAILCAQMVEGSLITSDNTLRKFATTKNITVRGHLWIFDQLVAHGIISPQEAIEKLTALRTTINPRLGLPNAECENRISQWKLLQQ